jgi:predicted dithiol-disulfide oxidoreductase (DUF899 family)
MTAEMQDVARQIMELKGRLKTMQAEHPLEPVEDWILQCPEGDVKLSQLFGRHADLILVHNMGKSCPYCTLWADGFTGYHRHLLRRASFVLCSPDSPEVQGAFADARGWPYCMVSDPDHRFTQAMGFWTETDGYWPGASAFALRNGQIYRKNWAVFGPGDDFCSVWPMFDLLDGGDAGLK